MVFIATLCPDQLWGPPSFLLNGYLGYFPGAKRPGREADHSSPSNAEVKNEWSHASTPLYALMAWTEASFPFLFLGAFP